MSRTPLFLAALASKAVPGLDPTSVQGLVRGAEEQFEVAYLQDAQDRRWVIKAPVTQAAGAELDEVSTLYQLLTRRIDVAVPAVRGSVPVPQGRAVVYLRAPGSPISFAALPSGPLAAEVGRVLAHVHNLERGLFDEAGRAAYDAATHRARLLSDLDRAASSGHVPTGLLSRWEPVFDDVSLWRFAETPIHGRFTGDNVMVSFDDPDDASSGRVRALLGWESARVGDPADDFAAVAAQCSPDAFDSVTEAYLNSRVERADRWLLTRARLAGEMRTVWRLLAALSAGQGELVSRAASRLRALDEQLWDAEPLHTPPVPGSLPREDEQGPDAAVPQLGASADLPLGVGDHPNEPQEPVALDAGLDTQGVPMQALLDEDDDETQYPKPAAGESAPGEGGIDLFDLPTQPFEPEDGPGHEPSSGDSGDVISTDDSTDASGGDSSAVSDAVLDTGEGASQFVRLDRKDSQG